MSEVDEAAIIVSPPNHGELAAAFRTWAGTDADLHVLFTPDVLIGFDTPARRGYLFDDGWSVEVWVERGLADLLGLLSPECLTKHCEIKRSLDDSSPQRGLLALALTKGAPIDEVRHLI